MKWNRGVQKYKSKNKNKKNGNVQITDMYVPIFAMLSGCFAFFPPHAFDILVYIGVGWNITDIVSWITDSTTPIKLGPHTTGWNIKKKKKKS
jgi:hypothetical protein